MNFFDPRNPSRGTDAIWNPGLTTQNFTIELTDKAGKVGSVAAASPRYGTALHQTTGSTTTRVHEVLNEVRVPLSDFAAQGVDLANLRKLELEFGGAGMPATGLDPGLRRALPGGRRRTDGLHRQARRRRPDHAPAGRAGARGRDRGRGGAGDPRRRRRAAAGCTTATRLGAVKLVKRRVTVSGTSCAASVKVTIAKVAGPRTSKALRATVKSAKWTAAATLTKGKYRVTAGTATKLVTVR